MWKNIVSWMFGYNDDDDDVQYWEKIPFSGALWMNEYSDTDTSSGYELKLDTFPCFRDSFFIMF